MGLIRSQRNNSTAGRTKANQRLCNLAQFESEDEQEKKPHTLQLYGISGTVDWFCQRKILYCIPHNLQSEPRSLHRQWRIRRQSEDVPGAILALGALHSRYVFVPHANEKCRNNRIYCGHNVVMSSLEQVVLIQNLEAKDSDGKVLQSEKFRRLDGKVVRARHRLNETLRI